MKWIFKPVRGELDPYVAEGYAFSLKYSPVSKEECRRKLGYEEAGVVQQVLLRVRLSAGGPRGSVPLDVLSVTAKVSFSLKDLGFRQ